MAIISRSGLVFQYIIWEWAWGQTTLSRNTIRPCMQYASAHTGSSLVPRPIPSFSMSHTELALFPAFMHALKLLEYLQGDKTEVEQHVYGAGFRDHRVYK